MLRMRVLMLLACGVPAVAGDATAQSGASSHDAIVQAAYLKASNTGYNDNFGSAVSVWGDIIVIGAPNEDSGGEGVNGDQTGDTVTDAGAAYVFVRSGTGWSQQAYLKAFSTSPHDQFGTSVSLSGDTLVIGAPGEDSGATGVNGDPLDNSASNAGAAYVYVRNGTTWTPQAYIKASNTGVDDAFGISVSVSGDTLVVGAAKEDSSATGVDGDQADDSATYAGAAYVFLRSGTTWSQQAYLKASNADQDSRFGFAVAASGDTVVIGAYYEDTVVGLSGAAYVFARDGTEWSEQAFLKAPEPWWYDRFGWTVAVSGDTVVVGAPEEEYTSWASGAVYVFARTGTSWSQQAHLTASNFDRGDRFGGSVALSGDTLVIGAPDERSNAAGVNGNQYDNSLLWAGASYVFRRSGTIWSQSAYLKASNTGEQDRFGGAVSVSDDTLVAGAVGERSNATGVNGDQRDNSAYYSGAAYQFDLGFDAWTNLGAGLAGTSDAPLLDGTGPLTASTSNQLELNGAKPSSAATLVVGMSQLNAPFKSGTLVPFPMLLLTLGTSPAGAATLPFTWPASMPSGTTVYFQFWVSDPGAIAGLSASNGLKGLSG